MADEKRPTVELGFTIRLQEDFIRCAEGMFAADEKERQFWRRMAYRALFGSLEAIMSVMRNHFIPDLIRERNKELLHTEEAQLYFMGSFIATDPAEWQLQGNGTGELRKKKLSFIPTLKAVVRMLLFMSRVPKADVEQQFGTEDWRQIKLAVTVRDRLMHPHKHEDIFVTDDDVNSLFAVAQWLQSLLKAIDFQTEGEHYTNEEAEASVVESKPE